VSAKGFWMLAMSDRNGVSANWQTWRYFVTIARALGGSSKAGDATIVASMPNRRAHATDSSASALVKDTPQC
jgi:hypothetical protein